MQPRTRTNGTWTKQAQPPHTLSETEWGEHIHTHICTHTCTCSRNGHWVDKVSSDLLQMFVIGLRFCILCIDCVQVSMFLFHWLDTAFADCSLLGHNSDRCFADWTQLSLIVCWFDRGLADVSLIGHSFHRFFIDWTQLAANFRWSDTAVTFFADCNKLSPIFCWVVHEAFADLLLLGLLRHLDFHEMRTQSKNGMEA